MGPPRDEFQAFYGSSAFWSSASSYEYHSRCHGDHLQPLQNAVWFDQREGTAINPIHAFPTDIYTEPQADVDTLANLGPRTHGWRLAGHARHGRQSGGGRPRAAGLCQAHRAATHRPADQRPQLFYGLRYHTQITKPGEVETYHDQVGYWLWEPATQTVIQTLTIPRGQVAMAGSKAAPDADPFELVATLGSATYCICSNPCLDRAFKTTEFRVQVGFNADGSWWYDETHTMQIEGQAAPFRHHDHNVLTKVAEPDAQSAGIGCA